MLALESALKAERPPGWVLLGAVAGVGAWFCLGSIFALPAWAEDEDNPFDDTPETRKRHRDELCEVVLQMYADGADGISTFNMFPHQWPIPGQDQAGWGGKREWSDLYGRSAIGYGWVMQALFPRLGDPEAIRAYVGQDDPDAGL